MCMMLSEGLAQRSRRNTPRCSCLQSCMQTIHCWWGSQKSLQSFVGADSNTSARNPPPMLSLSHLWMQLPRVGTRYRLELHCEKFQFLRIHSGMELKRPDIERMRPRGSITYLGATVAADGLVGSELNRRLGMAWAEYCELSQLWKHSSISAARKVEIFNAA